MKKIFPYIFVFSVFLLVYADGVFAQSFLFPYQGGTGTRTVPTAGQILIGQGNGRYVPAFLTEGSNVTITVASGSITIASTGGSGGSATTTINSVNGPTFLFTAGNDTNIGLALASSSNLFTWTPSWIGTLADSRITSAATWNAKQDAISWPIPSGSSTDSTSFPIGLASTTGIQGTITFPLPAASTTDNTSFPIGLASTTGIQGTITWPLGYASTTGIQNTITFPLGYGSTTHIGLPIPFASTTGFKFTAGTGMTVASSSGEFTFTNNGPTSIAAGTGISVDAATGTVTITNTRPHVTSTVVAPLVISGNEISMPTSTDAVSGFLSAADHTIFAAKQSTVSWPISVASTALAVGAGLDLDTNTLNTDFNEFGTIAALLAGDYFPVWQDTAGDEKKVSWASLKDEIGAELFPVGWASTTGFSFATSGSSGLQIASSSGTWTFSIATSTDSAPGFLSAADHTILSSRITTSSLSETVTGIDYNTTTGVFSITSGYEVPTTASTSAWNTDNVGAGGSTTTINGVDGPAFVFLKGANDTNITLALASSTNEFTWTPGWTGTLADARITSAANWNSKVSSSITLTAGTGLTGGGDLTANRTFTNNGVLSLTGTAPIAVDTATGTPTVSLSIEGGTCSAGNHVSAITATGTATCTADTGGAFTTTTINGLSTTAYTFATSGAPGAWFVFGAPGTITLNTATATAAITGFLSSTDWNTFNNKQAAITLTAGTAITIASTSPTWTINNNGVTSLTAGGAIGISSATGTPTIKFNGTFATSGLTGITIASTTNNTWTFSMATATAAVPGFLSAADFVTFNSKLSPVSATATINYATTTYFSATGTMSIPNGTAPTVAIPGTLAFDTTADQLIGATNTTAMVYGRAINRIIGVTYTSSSAYYASGSLLAAPVDPSGFTIQYIMCYTDTATATIGISDGTNHSNQVTCGTVSNATKAALTSNNAFTAGEKFYLRPGALTETPNAVTVGVWGYYTRE